MQPMYSPSLLLSSESLSSSDEMPGPLLAATALAAAFSASAAFLASAICLQPPSDIRATTAMAAKRAMNRGLFIVRPPRCAGRRRTRAPDGKFPIGGTITTASPGSTLALLGERKVPERRSRARMRASWNDLTRPWHQQITIEMERRFEVTRRGRAPASYQVRNIGRPTDKARRRTKKSNKKKSY